ncbi:MAG: class I SAM-dependent methyltransferase [Deltaproteobacteria bacterium]|nr:class I SAM-dependent methyltransferase [Deltaproteobacteria bacterium]
MTDFSETNWAKADFSKEYAENADIFILERRRLLEILKSFYRNFLAGRKNNILDLGCGDGVLTRELLGIDGSISATLVDASDDMLRRAKERLKAYEEVRLIKTGFQELLEKDALPESFDFIVSSLAIHHLDKGEKNSLFEYIYSHLNPGGYFLNIDVVLSPSEGLEEWYLLLWKEWIVERQEALNSREDFTDVPDRYKNKDNKPDILEDQLSALKSIGFKEVDCFYKYGIFSVYGGRRK